MLSRGGPRCTEVGSFRASRGLLCPPTGTGSGWWRAERAGPYGPRCLARVSAAESRRDPLRETPRLTTFRFVSVSPRFRSRFRSRFAPGASLGGGPRVRVGVFSRGVWLGVFWSAEAWSSSARLVETAQVHVALSFCGCAVGPGADVCPVPLSPSDSYALRHAVKAAAEEGRPKSHTGCKTEKCWRRVFS